MEVCSSFPRWHWLMEGHVGLLMDSLFVCTSGSCAHPCVGKRLLLLLRMLGPLTVQWAYNVRTCLNACVWCSRCLWRSLLSVLVGLDTQLRPSCTVLASTGPDGGLWHLMVHLPVCLVLFLSLPLSLNRSDYSVALALPLTSSFIRSECRVHFPCTL